MCYTEVVTTHNHAVFHCYLIVIYFGILVLTDGKVVLMDRQF